MNRLCRYVWLGVFLLANPFSSHAASDDSSAAEQRIIVKWKNNQSETQALSTIRQRFRSDSGTDLQQVRSLGNRSAVLHPESKLSTTELSAALETLNAQSEVEYAVLDQRRHAHAVTPNDPYFTATSNATGQWYLQASEPAAINAIGAWDVTQGSSSIVVAVLDTGVLDHEDLSSKFLSGYDFVSGESASSFLIANDGNGWDDDASDPGDWVSASDRQQSTFADCEVSDSSWHGTRVSGIIGAATDNGIGIAGTGWNTAILPVRVLGKCGGWDSDILAGMRWAAGLEVSGVATNTRPAKVINLSLGGTGECNSGYQDVIDELWDAGVIVVASAGNDNGQVSMPANCDNVVAVGGLRNEGDKADYSNLGREVTISAPSGNCDNIFGGDCLYSIDTTYNTGTTTPGTNSYTDRTNSNSGTSFSAPLVSGVLALMYSANAYLTPDRAVSGLTSSATAFPTVSSNICQVSVRNTNSQDQCDCTTSTCGAGMLNAYGAVRAAVDAYTVGGTVSGLSGTGLVLQNNGGDDLTVSANGAFTFASTFASGETYNVTVRTQPSNPTQTCSVGNASGTIANADISNVAVTCSTVSAVSSASGSGNGGGGGGLGLWELLVASLLLRSRGKVMEQ